MNDNSELIGRLFASELQFRLATTVEFAVHMGKQPLDLPLVWSYGKHTVEDKEIALRKDQADYAAGCLQRSATFLMAVAIKDAIIATVPSPINHINQNIRNAFQIARFIRNAFVHSNPFHPVWLIEEKYQDKVFEVEGIILLNTTNINGVTFEWQHYGGPLAVLKLCQFVRFEILKDNCRKLTD